jgi:hypothetical protein
MFQIFLWALRLYK